MDITCETTVADVATLHPATIKVFQQYHIDFCCGGKIPLADACARHGVNLETLLADLRAAMITPAETTQWEDATLTDLIAYIQQRYHVPLRTELGRLSAMLTTVVSRHGERLPEVLVPLQATFERFQYDLIDHMHKEDNVLFPAITALEAAHNAGESPGGRWTGIDQPIQVMEAEHEAAGVALATLREITRGYAPPEDACPTFRGLYHGLAELERDMHIHVHLENNILFPRATQLAHVT
ncbi:MAG: iron-sulfur cluster repair di-iron protein [Luteitalea sp.]|nr:iron-sulfur cluster repair di-iron protein [Luteitalea sp.]